MALSYTQRTLAHLRDQGYDPWIVERWIPNPSHPAGGITRDMFNMIDIVAVRGRETVGVQSTGPSGHATHRRAMLANPHLARLQLAGWVVWLVSWRKLLVRRGGKARQWSPRVERIEAPVGAVELEELLT